MFKRIFSMGRSGPVFYTSLAAALIGFGLFFDHAAMVGAPPSDAMAALHSDPARERLASDDVEDKRISDGSLHVAGQFYREHLSPLQGRASIAYVLPEVLPVRDVFSSYSTGTRFSFAQSPRFPAAARRPS